MSATFLRAVDGYQGFEKTNNEGISALSGECSSVPLCVGHEACFRDIGQNSFLSKDCRFCRLEALVRNRGALKCLQAGPARLHVFYRIQSGLEL